jgi:hypothetical protein
VFQYDYHRTCDYVWLVNESEHCRAELHFRIEDITGEGLTYNYEDIARSMEICRDLLKQEAWSIHEDFRINTIDSVQHWEVRRDGTLPELSQNDLLRVFRDSVQCLLEGHPSRYQQEFCWGALLCVSGRDHHRHIFDSVQRVDFSLHMTVPAWTSASDFTAFTSSLVWQGDVLQGHIVCAEGPLMFYAVATGLSSSRRDSLTQDFISKVWIRHFVR